MHIALKPYLEELKNKEELRKAFNDVMCDKDSFREIRWSLRSLCDCSSCAGKQKALVVRMCKTPLWAQEIHSHFRK